MVAVRVLRALACALLLGAALVLAQRAAADGGRRTDVRVEGSCTGPNSSELRVRAEDGQLRIEFRIDAGRSYGAWTVVLLRERRIVFRGAIRPRNGGRAVDLRRAIPDWPGTNTIVARASTRRVQSCRATAVI